MFLAETVVCVGHAFSQFISLFFFISEILIINGSLDLRTTWSGELEDQTSQLYISTVNNFTEEVQCHPYFPL